MARTGRRMRRLSAGLTAPPAANATWASTGAGEASIYIFARGTDGSVYERVISPNRVPHADHSN